MIPPEKIIRPCRSCGVRIFFAEGEKTGNLIPIDSAARPNGNYVTVMRNGKVIAEHYDPAAHGDCIRRVAHFATCSAAEQWRKKGEGK